MPPEVASWLSVPAGFGDKTDLAFCPRRLWRQDRLGSSVLGDLGRVTLERSFVLSWS